MFWLLAIIAYLLGSLSFAILLSRLTGHPDPRMSGSGNAGATNMLRLAGKKLAVLTLLGDLCKGLLPVLLANQLNLPLQQQAWIGVCAVIGHMYPLYFRFRGGKGVATAAGMLLGLYPPRRLAGCPGLVADLPANPYQFTCCADCHTLDPAFTGLARACRAAAHVRINRTDCLAPPRQFTRPDGRARTAFLIRLHENAS